MKKLLALISIVSLFLPFTAFADLSTGLVGYWPLDTRDGNGSSFDRSGNGNTGLWVNSPTLVAGKIGQALSFNGTNQYVSTNFQIQNYTTTNGSVSWWQYNNFAYNDSVEHFFWGQENSDSGNPSVPEFSCQKFTDNNIYCGMNGTSDYRVIIAANASNLPQGVWSFYTLVWTNGGNTILYQNGVQIGVNGDGTVSQSPLGHLQIGGAQTTFPTRFPGRLDDMRFYNRVLSSQEIYQLYRSGAGVHVGSTQGSIINTIISMF